jgi:predicted DNA-binding transcriptional regulator
MGGKTVNNLWNIANRNLFRKMNAIIEINKLAHTERIIIELLENKGKCLYGNIFKELKLSQNIGSKSVISLLKKNFIAKTNNSYYQLNGIVQR